MRRVRFTILRWMIASAILAANIGWVRFWLLDRAGYVLSFSFLNFFALQVGLLASLTSRGWAHRFWLGFEVAGLGATLISLCYLPGMPLERMFQDYVDLASELSYLSLPTPVDHWLAQHWDTFEAIDYFLTQLLAAMCGGLFAACVFKKTDMRGTRAITIPAAQAVP
jgi:hypothetical protein